MPGVKGIHGGRRPGAGRPRRFTYELHIVDLLGNEQVYPHGTYSQATKAAETWQQSDFEYQELYIVSREVRPEDAKA